MNVRNIDVPKLYFFGKSATARPVDFKINVGKWHKIISDRKLGAFGRIFVTHTEIVKIGDFDTELLDKLGYASIEEYLSEPFNKGLTVNDYKKVIFWNKFEANEDIIWEIMGKLL